MISKGTIKHLDLKDKIGIITDKLGNEFYFLVYASRMGYKVGDSVEFIGKAIRKSKLNVATHLIRLKGEMNE